MLLVLDHCEHPAPLGETACAVRHYAELTELPREQVGVPPAAETTALTSAWPASDRVP